MTRLSRLVVVPLVLTLLLDVVSGANQLLIVPAILLGLVLQVEAERTIRAWSRRPRVRVLPAGRNALWLALAVVAGGLLAAEGWWSATLAWGLIVQTGVVAGLRRTNLDRVLLSAFMVVASLLPLGLWGEGIEVLLMMGSLAACTVSLAIGSMIRNQQEHVEYARALMRTEERARMAVDLHDLVAHEVTGIVVLAQASAATTDNDQVRDAFARIEQSAQRALQEIRELVAQNDDPSPGTGPMSGLAALRDLADRFGMTSRIPVEVTLTEEEPPPQVGALLQRALAESLTNVRRHARPSRVVIRLDRNPHDYHLVVRNDGVAVGGIGSGNNSGLDRLRERASLLGGTLTAGPVEPGGWVTELRLPMEGR